MKYVGLDPGSQRAGYALLQFEGGRVVSAKAGVWELRGSRPQALSELARVSSGWLAEQEADAAAVEGVFHFKNVRSALALAEARGVLLSVVGSLNVPVFDYAPATVKKTVCGHGTATKEQVRDSLRRTVPGLERFQFDGLWHDAIDAVALAVCHATHARLSQTLTRGRA